MAIEIVDFDNLEYDKPKDVVYDKETGEIIKDKTIIELAVEKQEKQERYDKAKKKELKRVLGKVDKKETHYLKWKSGNKVQFIKIYRTELREYMKSIKLSPNAGLFLFCIETYIEHETNRIAKTDGTNFTNKELEDLTGLTVRIIKYTLDELEDKHFIKRIGQKQAREIYFNPHLCCAGTGVLLSTIELFSEYKPMTPY
jgi:DNA-binding MarR family transcriptional regulator